MCNLRHCNATTKGVEVVVQISNLITYMVTLPSFFQILLAASYEILAGSLSKNSSRLIKLIIIVQFLIKNYV